PTRKYAPPISREATADARAAIRSGIALAFPVPDRDPRRLGRLPDRARCGADLAPALAVAALCHAGRGRCALPPLCLVPGNASFTAILPRGYAGLPDRGLDRLSVEPGKP